MISFLNDYNEIGHKKVLEDMLKIYDKKFVGYSEDELVDKAKDLIKEKLKKEDLDIYFVHGGTIANVLGLMLGLQRYEAVISADSGHIVNHENASIEAIGNQIILTPSRDGKIQIEALEKAVKDHTPTYTSKPGVVYISNLTEVGTLYKKEELEKLRDFCHAHDLFLFCDGARLATATMSNHTDVKFEDYPKYFDAFTIGGTKNGFLFGEALVVVSDKLKSIYTPMLIKQRGALLAKGFLYGSQFITMFQDDLYFDLAKNSVQMADRLAKGLEVLGLKLNFPCQGNLVFLDIDKGLNSILEKNFLYDQTENDKGKISIRLVTSWNTKEEEVDSLLDQVKEYMK